MCGSRVLGARGGDSSHASHVRHSAWASFQLYDEKQCHQLGCWCAGQVRLDVPTSARTRLIEELQFATNAVNERPFLCKLQMFWPFLAFPVKKVSTFTCDLGAGRWGGSDFSGGLRVHQDLWQSAQFATANLTLCFALPFALLCTAPHSLQSRLSFDGSPLGDASKGHFVL